MQENSYIFSKQQSEQINLARLLLAVLVVLGHAYSEMNAAAGHPQLPQALNYLQFIIFDVLCTSSVPGFFLISSVLLYRRPIEYGKNIRKKFRTLMVPYLLMISLWIFALWAGQGIPFTAKLFAQENTVIRSWTAENWLAAYFGHRPLLGALWFLRDLFLLNLLAPVFERITHSHPDLAAVGFAAVWLLCPAPPLPYLDLQGICFWGLGCCLVKLGWTPTKLEEKIKAVAALYLLLLAAAAAAYIPLYDGIFHRGCRMAGVLFWYCCAGFLQKSALGAKLAKLSAYSMDIYLFHQILLSLLKKCWTKILLAKFGLSITAGALIPSALLLAVCTVGCCIVGSRTLKRVFPQGYRILTGGRTG